MQNSFLPFPDPSFSRFDSSGFFLLGGGLGVVKEILYCEKVQNVNELHDRIIRDAECGTNKILANTCQETDILMCVVPFMVPILSTEHIRNFVRSNV
jgi:hypothetical protein